MYTAPASAGRASVRFVQDNRLISSHQWRMSNKNAASLDRAAGFIWSNARLLERAQFVHLFVEPSPQRVVAALSAYVNADGGVGNALEADLRAPTSIPLACEAALIVLRQSAIVEPTIAAAMCDYLESMVETDGRVPIVTREILEFPRAPHWNSPAFGGDSPNPTAGLVGLLEYQSIQHPWMSRAADWCWRRLERPLDEAHEAASVMRFLEHAPDRRRAREVALRIAREAEQTKFFQLHPDSAHYGVTPLHLCPGPDSIAAQAFGQSTLGEHLDELAARQQPDGGWPISWDATGPGAEMEWRGRVTLDALITLRAYGRI
jgi:hypothetical protein